MPEQQHTKIAVVTGGSAGVGRATVRLFAESGYDLAVLARGRAGIEAAAAEVRERGQRGLALSVDVADGAAVAKATEAIEAELGPIDVWVNCAFVGALTYFWDTSDEAYRRITDVTYMGQVNGTRSALSVMRARDAGVIVNVSSALAYRSIPLQAAYCGAKHAVKGFTESVITELAHEKSHVRIGMVTLPGINTPQFDWNLNEMPGHPMPNPPLFQPEVAARAIVGLAAHPRRNVWVGLPAAASVLGNRLAPSILDWYLGRAGVDSQQTDDDAPVHGSNLFEAKDDDIDRGARGAFDDIAHTSDPVSVLSATVGRSVEAALGATLSAIGSILDLRKKS